MKGYRFIVLGVLFAVLCTTVQAQPRLRTPEFYLGVHGGVTAGTVQFTPRVEGMKPITNACVLGGNGGLVFRFAKHKYCAFQMELNYMHRGWATYTETAGHYYRDLHYIDLPILMHLNVGGEVCRWLFNLGPQIGYCFKDEKHVIDHPFYWGVVAGTGVQFNSRKAGVFEIEARFDFAFGGVVGTKATDKFSMASPMDLSLNFGWLYPIKKKKKIK